MTYKLEDLLFINDLTKDLGCIEMDALREFSELSKKADMILEHFDGDLFELSKNKELTEINKKFTELCEERGSEIMSQIKEYGKANRDKVINPLTMAMMYYASRHERDLGNPFFIGLIFGMMLHKNGMMEDHE